MQIPKYVCEVKTTPRKKTKSRASNGKQNWRALDHADNVLLPGIELGALVNVTPAGITSDAQGKHHPDLNLPILGPPRPRQFRRVEIRWVILVHHLSFSHLLLLLSRLEAKNEENPKKPATKLRQPAAVEPQPACQNPRIGQGSVRRRSEVETQRRKPLRNPRRGCASRRESSRNPPAKTLQSDGVASGGDRRSGPGGEKESSRARAPVGGGKRWFKEAKAGGSEYARVLVGLREIWNFALRFFLFIFILLMGTCRIYFFYKKKFD